MRQYDVTVVPMNYILNDDMRAVYKNCLIYWTNLGPGKKYCNVDLCQNMQ